MHQRDVTHGALDSQIQMINPLLLLLPLLKMACCQSLLSQPTIERALVTYFHGYDHKYVETTEDYYNISMKVGTMGALLGGLQMETMVNRSGHEIRVELEAVGYQLEVDSLCEYINYHKFGQDVVK